MEKTPQSNKLIGSILFTVGILLGTLLFAGFIWSDVEAVFYGLPQLTNNKLDGFSCPALMTRTETANLRVTVQNETDLPISPMVRFEISAPGIYQSERLQVHLKPGESTTLAWPVSQKNIDLDYFIFAKAYRYPEYKTTLAEATCGILVLNIPFMNGAVLLAIWLGASLICTLAGLWILEPRNAFPGQTPSMHMARRVLVVTMLVGLILGIQGAWLPGILTLVVMILLLTILLYFALSH